MVLSHAATQLPGEPEKVWGAEDPNRQMIFFMDISRAYFNAKVDESDPVYVELPPEVVVVIPSVGDSRMPTMFASFLIK